MAKANHGKTEINEAEAAREAATVPTGTGRGRHGDGEAVEVEETAAEEKVEVDIGSPVVLRTSQGIKAAIITAVHADDKADLVYFHGSGAGYASGATNVKKGLKSGQWWHTAADVRAAIREGV